jgi:HEAT repeat protein
MNERSACADLGSAAIAPLTAILQEEDPGLCREAAQVLGEINDPEAVEPLLSVLERNPDADVRSAAIRALTKHEGARVTIGLRRALDGDPDAVVRRAAAEALATVEAPLDVRLPARFLKTEKDLDACRNILKLLEKLEINETWEILLDVHQACAHLETDLDAVDNWAGRVELAKDRIGAALLRESGPRRRSSCGKRWKWNASRFV